MTSRLERGRNAMPLLQLVGPRPVTTAAALPGCSIALERNSHRIFALSAYIERNGVSFRHTICDYASMSEKLSENFY